MVGSKLPIGSKRAKEVVQPLGGHDDDKKLITARSSVENRLLRALPREDYERLLPKIEPVHLTEPWS